MVKKLYCFISFSFLIIFSAGTFAQNSEIDSLQSLLTDGSGPDSVKIFILNDLAFAYYQIDLEKTKQFAEQADSLSEISGNRKGKAISLNNIGLYYYAKSDYNKALNYFEKSLAISEKINDKAGKAKTFNNIGIIHEIHGDYTKAIEYYRKSLKMKAAIGDSLGMASSYNNMGIVNHNLGDYSRALEYYQKCLDIEKALFDSCGMAGSYNNIGAIYKETGDFTKALDYHRNAYIIRKELGDSSGTASSLNNIGVIYSDLNEHSKALDFYKEALKIAESIGNKRQMALYLYYIGSCYLQQKKYEKAQDQFQKALKIAEEISVLSIISRINTGLCTVFFEQKKYERALKYGGKAYQTAFEIEHRELIKEASYVLSKVFAAAQNYEKAYYYHIIYKQQSDSLINKENIKKITALEIEYKYEKQRQLASAEQERINAVKEQELIRQKTIRNSFMISFALTFIFLVLILRSFNQKRKANATLQDQKQIIENTNEKLKAALKLVSEQKDQIYEQHKLVEKQNKHITDSINYASRIQNAALPKDDLLQKILPNHFVLFKPRDIVSGDFYRVEKVHQQIIVVTADCTGHGVPGAFMSMLGMSVLNEIIRKERIDNSAHILNELRNRVKETLYQTGDDQEQKDGMDMAVYILDLESNSVDYAGANIPLYLVRKGELIIYKPNNQPIGIFPLETPFENHIIQLQKGDCLYTFSDGFQDQTGGEKKQKFMEKQLQKVLKELFEKKPIEQKLILEEILSEWQGDNPQMDDILVFGLKI
jgi:serine phosphatase RsbU (regulator of sigma subunit)